MWSFYLLLSVLPIILGMEVEATVVLAKMKAEVKLECSSPLDQAIIWKKKLNNTIPDSTYTTVEIGSNFEKANNTLKIKKMEEHDFVIYACFDDKNETPEKIKEFDVRTALKLKRLPKSISVDVGGSTQDHLKCVAMSEDKLVIRWYRRDEGTDDNSTLTPICGYEHDHCIQSQETPSFPRLSITYTVTEDSVTSTLVIDAAALEDRAIYVCHAIDEKHMSEKNFTCDEKNLSCEEAFTLVRVKDPLAAVWPFVGIVIEVVVLCLVIFICERRKKADDKEDIDDNGYAGGTGNNQSSNNSLRQRK